MFKYTWDKIQVGSLIPYSDKNETRFSVNHLPKR